MTDVSSPLSDTSACPDAQAKPRRSIGAQRNPNSEKAILEAAAEILREEGYKGFSIEKVAKRAKAGKPTIYRWWPSKAALLLDVYMRCKRVSHPDCGNIEDDITTFILAVFRSWRETATGEIFSSLIAEAQSDPDASKVLSGYAADRRECFGKLIARAQERGEVSADIDPLITADWVASWMWCHLLTGRIDGREDETRQAVRQITRGIVKR